MIIKLDFKDPNKQKIWRNFLNKFEIEFVNTLPDSEYDFIITDSESYLKSSFNHLILESNKKIDLINVTFFNKYTPQQEIYDLFDQYQKDFYILSKEDLLLNLQIDYFIKVKNKFLKINKDKYQSKTQLFTNEKGYVFIQDYLFKSLKNSSDPLKALNIGYNSFQLKIDTLGLSPENLLFAEEIISETVKNFNNPFFREAINNQLNNPNYMSEFILKSYIGSSIANSLDFNLESTESLIKSFFLSDSINKDSKDHPIEISNQILKNKTTSRIILEHHERPFGKGFPNKLQTKEIHPLTRIYIISECFFILLDKFEYQADKKRKIINILEEKFSEIEYAEIIHTLKYLFYKKTN